MPKSMLRNFLTLLSYSLLLKKASARFGPARRLARRFIAGEEIDDLMMLCRADITSKNPAKVKQYLTNFDLVEAKMRVVEEKDNLRNFKLAIDGIVIMKTLNISPGPVVGQIKETITDAVLDGEIPNEPEACFQYLLKIKDKFILN